LNLYIEICLILINILGIREQAARFRATDI